MNAQNAANLMQHDLFGHEPVPFEPKVPRTFEKAFPGPDMVRVSPTVWAWKPADPERVPKYGRCMWIKNPDGVTYRPAPQTVRFVILCREVLDEIGFRGMSKSVSDTTLRRLALADEILLIHISPKVRMLDLDSWWKFIDDCITNPDKWEEGSDSHRNYLFRNALGKHKVMKG